MKTVVGLFDTRDQAEKAVKTMRDKGFKENEISIVAKGKGGKEDIEAGDEGGMNLGQASSGAAWGGTIGGAAGLLAGAGALAIPGIGPIVAAGPIAAALSGALTGGIAGGLIDFGIPEERGKYYEEQVKKGKFLALVETDDNRISEASDILRNYGANDVESH